MSAESYELCNITYILPFKRNKNKKQKNIFWKKIFMDVISNTLSGDFGGLCWISKKLDSPATLKLALKLGQSRPI